MQVRARSDSLLVTWQPPQDASVMVRGYIVGWGAGVPDIHSKRLDRNARQFAITELQANREYVISLKAFNNVGQGFPVYETMRTLNENEEQPENPLLATPLGLVAITQSSTTILLVWTDAELSSVVNGAPGLIKISMLEEGEGGGRAGDVGFGPYENEC